MKYEASDERMYERQLEERFIYKGKLFSVKADEVETSWGKRTVREIVVHPGAVVIIPMLDEDTVILVKQYRYAASKILLELPAGVIERGERPEESAMRELEEETGFRAERIEKLGSLYLAPGYSTEVAHFYIAEGLIECGQKPEPDEKIKIVPMKIRDLLQMVKNGELEDAKTVAGILMLMLRKGMVPL